VLGRPGFPVSFSFSWEDETGTLFFLSLHSPPLVFFFFSLFHPPGAHLYLPYRSSSMRLISFSFPRILNRSFKRSDPSVEFSSPPPPLLSPSEIAVEPSFPVKFGCFFYQATRYTASPRSTSFSSPLFICVCCRGFLFSPSPLRVADSTTPHHGTRRPVVFTNDQLR